MSVIVHGYAQQSTKAVPSALMTLLMFFFQSCSDERCFRGKPGTSWAGDAILCCLLCLCLTNMFALRWWFGELVPLCSASLYWCICLEFMGVFRTQLPGSLASFPGIQRALIEAGDCCSSLTQRSICTLNLLCWTQYTMDMFRSGKIGLCSFIVCLKHITTITKVTLG